MSEAAVVSSSVTSSSSALAVVSKITYRSNVYDHGDTRVDKEGGGLTDAWHGRQHAAYSSCCRRAEHQDHHHHQQQHQHHLQTDGQMCQMPGHAHCGQAAAADW